MTRVVKLPPDTPDQQGIKAAGWWRDAENDLIRCDLCPRHCLIGQGKRGFCFVRENRQGELVSTTYGRSTGFCIDPIEKKPLNHFYPGSAVLSFGTAGCNLGCVFCQNWTSSRSRDTQAAADVADPQTIAKAAAELGCQSVAFTYNDPIIWAEYAIDTAVACHARAVKTVAVTSGFITADARGAFFQHIDAANVDLKGFTEEFYREYCGASLQPVLDTLKWLVEQSEVWLEITNLIIPGANDSPDEIQRMCGWIVDELGPDVPIHFTAFHPDFKLVDRGSTPPETLTAACVLAKRAGLRYVYAGNVSDRSHQSTYCPACGKMVIERAGYNLGDFQIADGRCRHCNAKIAGHFDDTPGDWAARRMPIRIGDYK